VLLRLAVALFLLYASVANATSAAWPGTVQAAKSDWNAQTPPATGWVDVTLPDNWSVRWPGFDGVVWYRLTWNQSAPLDDVALYIENLTFAGEISVNGALLGRDASLIEPLSRGWNVPRYWRLPPPLLRAGENTLLVRVSGLSQYQPGLGPVQVGPAAPLHLVYETAWWLRQRLAFVSLGIGVTLGLFFLVLWLMRRREVAYGWYGAQQLVWLPIAWNVVATSPWPFATTDPYQNVTEVAVPLFAGCWTMFVLRFCERRWPRREIAMWVRLRLHRPASCSRHIPPRPRCATRRMRCRCSSPAAPTCCSCGSPGTAGAPISACCRCAQPPRSGLACTMCSRLPA
jgi:hypothetical protein